MFNSSLLEILESNHELDKFYNKNLKHSSKKNLNNAIMISPSILQSIKRPQSLIETTEDYYISKDLLSGRIYICFKNLLMLDIDVKDHFILNEKFIIKYFSSFEDKCFSIYKTKNGFHVFDVSEKHEYYKQETLKFMLENFSDYFYSIYSFLRGWSVRLTRKKEENGEIYSHIGIYGEKTLVKDELLKLVELHFSLSKKFNSYKEF